MDKAGDIFSGALHGVESGADWLGGELSSGLHGLEGLFSGGSGVGGSTGQPSAGSPGASALSIGQSHPEIPDIGKARASSPMSAASFAAGPGDSAVDRFASHQDYSGLNVGGALPPIDPNLASVLSSPGTGGATAPAATAPHHTLLQDAFAAIPLGLGVIQGNKVPDSEKQLKAFTAEAGNQVGFNNNLANSAIQGKLPGGAEAGIQQQIEAEKAKIRAAYSGMGLSGSSAEAQDLAAVDERATAQRFQIGANIAQQGWNNAINEQGLEGSGLTQIYKMDTARGTEVGNAIAEFMKFAAV